MFCENCGAKIDDDALFCTECGTKRKVPEIAPEFTQNEAQAGPSVVSNEPVSKQHKKLPVYCYIIAAVVVAAVIAVLVFLHIKNHTINANDYITVEFNGYNTMGTAEVSLDEEFWVELYEKSDFKDKKKLEKKDFFDDEEDIAFYMEGKLYDKIKYDVDPETKLSNKDEVEVSWKVKTDYLKKNYGVTVKAEDKKFKVEGLKKVKEFNPFDDVKVTFSGLDGDGQASVEVTAKDELYDYFSFSISDNYGLSTGDKVTVTFAQSYSESDLKAKCAEQFGKVPTTFEKEYTVKGLGHYVLDVSEITEKSAADIITEGQEEVEDNLEDDATLKEAKYLGSYLLANTEDTAEGNYLFTVYEVTTELKDEESGETDSITYYTMVETANIYIDDTGKCEYSSFYGIYNNTFNYESSFGKDYYCNGYESLDDIKADIDNELEWYESYGFELSSSLK